MLTNHVPALLEPRRRGSSRLLATATLPMAAPALLSWFIMWVLRALALFGSPAILPGRVQHGSPRGFSHSSTSRRRPRWPRRSRCHSSWPRRSYCSSRSGYRGGAVTRRSPARARRQGPGQRRTIPLSSACWGGFPGDARVARRCRLHGVAPTGCGLRGPGVDRRRVSAVSGSPSAAFTRTGRFASLAPLSDLTGMAGWRRPGAILTVTHGTRCLGRQAHLPQTEPP
jgi:hypothetical protein